MTTRIAGWKKSLMALAFGGSLFHLTGFGFDSTLFNCGRNLQNIDLQTFYQDVGSNVVATTIDGAFDDGRAAGIIGSDFDRLFRRPLTDLGASYWNNWIFLRFAQDPSRLPIVKQ